MTLPTEVDASPTKRFFVEMLTRDIELEDAILDLLDNCLDGALRHRDHDLPDERKYEGFWARIHANRQSFMIEDNCGGIPLDIAVEYAFRMGRKPTQDDSRDMTIESVGMYGIGMKRAFFKMGAAAIVTSCTPTHKFSVNVEANWLADDSNWSFPLTEEHRTTEDLAGTVILVADLHEGVSVTFSDENFEARLRERIAEHYSLIIQKGFKVFLNDDTDCIRSSVQRLVFVSDGIKPFYFDYAAEGMSVFFAIGLNAPALGDQEDDDGPMSARRSYDDGGWTVYCNDRAILVRDKTRVTGWGDGAPTYHWQFSVISGMVEFRAKDASMLPVGTTKRTMDTSSDLFLLIRREMASALKVFTDYTNAWRHDRRKQQDVHFANADYLDLPQLKASADRLLQEGTTKRTADLRGARLFNPRPLLTSRLPPGKKSSTRRIVFTRDLQEIRSVGEYLLADENAKPAQVGERCFESVLKLAQER